MTMNPVPASISTTGSPGGAGHGGGGGGRDEELSPGQRLTNHIINASSMGLVVSVLIHAAITLFAALVTVGVAGIGSRGSGGGEFDLTVTSPAQLTGVGDVSIDDVSAPVVADKMIDEIPTAGVDEGAGGFDSPGAGAGLGQIAEGSGGAGGGDVGDGSGLGQGGSGSGKGTSFFGVEAKGSRFLYICDISGSMNWGEDGVENGKRLRTLKRELTDSVNSMSEEMSFYVIFFSSGAAPINPESHRWIPAKDNNKRWAVEKIGNQQAFGGTEPWGAFELGFQMRPAPDAIYFMTDGAFNAEVASKIAMVNVGSRKVPIHCICLVDRSGEEVMRKIAVDSGGTFTYVPGLR
jgi:hypothetical protein